MSTTIGDLSLIATIEKAKGLHGKLIVRLATLYSIIKDIHTIVYVNREGSYIPYRLLTWKLNERGTHALVAFQNLNTRTEAVGLKGNEIFLPQTQLEKVFQVEQPYNWISFIVEDIYKGPLGYLKQIHSRKLQPLLEIDYSKQTLLIPLHESFVKDIDITKKKVTVCLPEDYLRELN